MPAELADPPRACSSAPERARGAGSWSPAELLAQVVRDVQAEERTYGDPAESTWEPVPLDATQPVSSEEVAARLGAEGLVGGGQPTPPPAPPVDTRRGR